MDHTKRLSTAALNVLERVARNTALEQRLIRECVPNLGKAVEAVRRETDRLIAEAALVSWVDERGDRWLLLNGHPVVFLGHEAADDSSALTPNVPHV